MVRTAKILFLKMSGKKYVDAELRKKMFNPQQSGHNNDMHLATKNPGDWGGGGGGGICRFIPGR